MRKYLFVVSLIVLTSLFGLASGQQKPEQKPEQKVEQKPAQKPEQKPEAKPEQKLDESASQVTKILTGEVVTVDATKNEVVIKDEAGTEVHVSIAASTKFFKGEKAITLADVKVGDTLTCECEKPGEGCKAKSIVVTSPSQKPEQKPEQKVEQKPAQKPEQKPEAKPEQKTDESASQATKILTGEVVTVDATKNEVVIKDEAGTEVHLSIAASTKFFRGEKAIALADVKVGDKLTCECEKPGEGCKAKSIVVTSPSP